jgi:hypothetical protein
MTGPSPRVASALAWAVIGLVAAALLSGFFLHPGALGAHDWDQMASHRLFVVKAIRDFGRFPYWDPYGCGGFPAWGSPESATIVVSPWLPFYLALPLGVAIRVEVVGSLVAMVVGCHFLARRYTSDPVALGFAVLVGALNSRMALQMAVGHTWHLAYAGLPWALGACDRAMAAWDRGDARSARVCRGVCSRWVAFGAVVIALMTYAGGVYPVPHTALCLLGVGAHRAFARRDARPLMVVGAMLLLAALLAAPKALPVFDTMSRFPRATNSRETVDPRQWLQMFLSSVNDVPGLRMPGLDYMWQEYGQYIGLLPLAFVLWINLRRLPAADALRSLRFAGWALFAFALGVGPWRLLHSLPIFRSQRVPTRFTFPAFVLLSTVAAAELGRRSTAWRERFGARFDAALWTAFVVSAALIAREDARCTAPWFDLTPPDTPDRTDGYIQYAEVPAAYAYGDGNPESPGGTNGAPGLLLHRANVGAIRCSSFPGLNQEAPLGSDGRPLHLGARGIGDPGYRGEYWAEPSTRVDLLRWAPGEVVVRLPEAPAGTMVVLDQNWDPGWTANGEPAVDRDDVDAYRTRVDSETVTFRYRPRTLSWGLALLALGMALLALCAVPWRARADADRLRVEMPREDVT